MTFEICGEVEADSRRLAYLILRNHFDMLAAGEESRENVEVTTNDDENDIGDEDDDWDLELDDEE